MDRIMDVDLGLKEKLESALKLNRQMQLQLLVVKDKIEKLLKNAQEIYTTNENIMRNNMQKQRRRGKGIRGAYLRGGTFYLKGSMFFKDFDCRNCPDNPDYKKRKANNEMFPMDLDLQGRHIWSLKDKKGVVDGIKEQIIDHLNDRGQQAELPTKEYNSEKLVKLLQMVSSDFRIDWELISQHNLQHRHTKRSCEAIWNVYLNPALKRSKWTEGENLKLLDVVRKYNCQDWQAIAAEVGARSDFQCFVQYQNYVCYMTSEKANRWSKEDDAKLIEVIGRNTMNGIINWSNVMVHFPQKPRTTLQSRYTYSLNPGINHDPFTPEEDLLLLASVKEYGTKFSCFPRTLFPNRTTVQLRSRYRNTLVHRHKQQSWTLEDDTKLMEFVAKNGTKSWKRCEDFVESHSRISCRTRYLVISKYFEKNPNATLEDLPRKKQKAWNYVNTQNWTEKLMELSRNPNAKLVQRRRKEREKKTEPRNRLSILNEDSVVDKPTKKEPKPRKRKRSNYKQDRRKPVYVERLRANGLRMYHCFKYAYDFELGRDPCSTTKSQNCSKLVFAKTALKLQELPSEMKGFKLDSNIPTHMRPNINRALKQERTIELPDGFSLPPSWSTAIGFRALCIHTARSDLHAVTNPNLDDSDVHIQRFRDRLRIVFYTTALLSRLHPMMAGIGQSSNKNAPQKKSKVVHKSAVDQVLSIKQEKMEMCQFR